MRVRAHVRVRARARVSSQSPSSPSSTHNRIICSSGAHAGLNSLRQSALTWVSPCLTCAARADTSSPPFLPCACANCYKKQVREAGENCYKKQQQEARCYKKQQQECGARARTAWHSSAIKRRRCNGSWVHTCSLRSVRSPAQDVTKIHWVCSLRRMLQKYSGFAACAV